MRFSKYTAISYLIFFLSIFNCLYVAPLTLRISQPQLRRTFRPLTLSFLTDFISCYLKYWCSPCLNAYVRLWSKHDLCASWLLECCCYTAYTLTYDLPVQAFNQCTNCQLGSIPCFNAITGYYTIHIYLAAVRLAHACLSKGQRISHTVDATMVLTVRTWINCKTRHCLRDNKYDGCLWSRSSLGEGGTSAAL